MHVPIRSRNIIVWYKEDHSNYEGFEEELAANVGWQLELNMLIILPAI
jgi:hypothetical protein